MQHALLQLIASRRGHFRMESGYHSELWFELERMFDQPERLQPFVAELARKLAAHRVDAVCGPMTGGAKLAEMIARELGVAAFAAGRFAPRDAAGLFQVKYRLPAELRERVRGKRVAIVDDAISAGSAVRGTLADLVECGAQPVVCGALIVFGAAIDRFTAEHSLALEYVTRTEFRMWPPAECPLCKAAVPVERVSDTRQTPHA